MDSAIFSHLQIADGEWLNEVKERYKCPKCLKSRKYFCFICNIPVCGIDSIPKIKLPVEIDILKHESEFHGKSTSCHAFIIAPSDVVIHKYPIIPEFDPEETLLLLPGDSAKPLSSYVNVKTKLNKFKRVIVIDCTWNQVTLMGKDERLKNIPRIELNEHEGHFWRHKGDRPSTYLSTIEAIYYLCVEWHQNDSGIEYDGRYDNLLFYFKYLYDKLYTITDGGANIRAYNKLK